MPFSLVRTEWFQRLRPLPPLDAREDPVFSAHGTFENRKARVISAFPPLTRPEPRQLFLPLGPTNTQSFQLVNAVYAAPVALLPLELENTH